MSEADVDSTKATFEALTALEADAPKLERIESLLDHFNIFEAIGFRNQETMHSRFLAFLLDPTQNHGLGTRLLEGFLQKTSESIEGVPPSHVIGSAKDENLDQMTVETEVHTGDGRIDILLLNRTRRWAMVIENKVWSAERPDQLDKYHRFVRQSYPGWRIFGVYLTPFGTAPSRARDRQRYRILHYGAVCDIVDRVLADRGPRLDPNVRMALEHYAEMVRRNILGEAEITKLSRDIYRKHHRALQRILEDFGTISEAVHRVLKSLIREAPSFDFGYRETEPLRDWIVFDHREWDVPALQVGERYRDSHRLLYFVFRSDLSGSIEVWLELGPGDPATRNRLLDLARRNASMFVEMMDTAGDYWSLFKRSMLTSESFDNLSGEERERSIRRQWAAFLEDDLPRIEEALKGEAWVWKPTGASGGR